jgi:hypothetical protein
MTTAQIILTDSETDALHELARLTGKTEDELLQEAVKVIIKDVGEAEVKRQKWLKSLQQAKGMWKDRDDLPDFDQLRKEWDRPGLWDED